jgi:hypothetical protein
MVLDLLWKTSIPKKIPKGMQAAVREINKAKTPKDALKKAHRILTKKFHGASAPTYPLIHRTLFKDLNYLWNQKGFMHCTNFNYLLRVLLVKSEFFKDEDIELKWTLHKVISLHQYIQVKIKNKKIPVDPWAYHKGIDIGAHAY